MSKPMEFTGTTRLAAIASLVLLPATASPRSPAASQPQSPQSVISDHCQVCHNDTTLLGNMSLDAFDASRAEEHAELSEKMIRKLRAGMMPPPGMPRPDDETLDALASALETRIDSVSTARPNPGRRSFQRLNRAEYSHAIRDLLALEIEASDFLPLDTKSANFDNIADVQMLSATLMEGYLRAASEVARLAIGDPNAGPREATYKVTRWVSQSEQVEGAPYGTRGGVSVMHTLPADGHYRFRVSFHHETTGALYGSAPATLHTDAGNLEQIEISVNGARVALMDIDRWMHASDPDGLDMRTEPIFVHSGPQRISAAFIPKTDGPVQDLIRPHDWSIASTSIADAYGLTSLPHLRDLAITGPFNPTGVSDSPSRRRVFSCHPDRGDDPTACAKEVVTRIGSHAYRRGLSESETQAILSLYHLGVEQGGFEVGIRTSLEGILASPNFAFRFEEPPEQAQSGAYAINDFDLATRLSFFLWGTVPDEGLLALAEQAKLSQPDVLRAETLRMIADPRSSSLASRFASQWLRLPDLANMHPNVRTYPNFHEQLKQSMRTETMMFVDHLIREDRSVLELLTADYSFMDERLARHYGLKDVAGKHFRRVSYPDERRRGLLGHGSILALTSHASRTSPVLRGKWIMEVLLGNPPPPPPPDVPELDSEEAEGGRLLSVREQMEKHRASPACNSCHRTIDPLGLALENFDATGAWRIRDRGVSVNAAGELYDGTALSGPADLRQALVNRSTSVIRNFIENLMAYGLGRRVEPFDMPTIRAIERRAAGNGNRMSSFILGVVQSPAFQRKAVPRTMETEADNGNP